MVVETERSGCAALAGRILLRRWPDAVWVRPMILTWTRARRWRSSSPAVCRSPAARGERSARPGEHATSSGGP